MKYNQVGANLIGQTGKVLTALSPVGTVQLTSETWSAVSSGEEEIGAGEKVEVVEVDGLLSKCVRRELERSRKWLHPFYFR